MKLTGDEQFWLILWNALFITIIIIVITIAGCSEATSKHNELQIIERHKAVAKMVSKGIDPKSAGCAIALAKGSADSETKLYCSK